VVDAGGTELLLVVLLRSVVVPFDVAASAVGGGGAVVVVVVIVGADVDACMSGRDWSPPRVEPVVRWRGPLSDAGDEDDDIAVGGTGAIAPDHHGKLVDGARHPYGSILIPWAAINLPFCEP